MRLEEFPGDIRVKLEEEGGERLWGSVDDSGGIREFCSRTGFAESRLYSWRSKDVFLPVEFVLRVLGDEASAYVGAYKGGGRSLPVEKPALPVPESRELLTRVQESVVVNQDGVPVYIADELSLVRRFRDLLSGLGDVPVSLYSRGRYELRYPKYLHEILSEMEFEPDFAALVDESGRVEDGELRAADRSVPLEEFSGELFSRSKRFELALARGDSERIREIIAEEGKKVREAV